MKITPKRGPNAAAGDWANSAPILANTAGDPNEVVLKGHIQKKSRFGIKQLRLFVLYRSGKILYYKDLSEYSGTLMIDQNSNIRKTGRKEITLYD